MTDRDFQEAVALVDTASGPEQLFGAPGRHGATTPEAERRYRRLAARVHPDRAPESRAADAHRAFTRLESLWRRYRGDDTGPVFRSGGDRYRIGRPHTTGDVANLYGTRRDDGDRGAVLKLARHPADNDLIRGEAAALERLAERGDPAFSAYVPRLRGVVRHRDTDGAERHGNLLPLLTGFHDLTEVAAAYPGGVDPRDAAWMWRRLLVGLGHAHRAGVVHGAVLPEHVMIHPELHGVIIVDWCYAALDGAAVPAMVARYTDWYPVEVPGRRPAGPFTDIHLATRTMARLIGDRMPDPMRDFVRGCTQTTPAARPDDAWRLLTEFDDLLARLYGPRRFRPFHLPTDPR
ncbi:hypothetical protein LX16_0424 [Stackebrandtia albiflava]|uniref:Protein kinase domain-containing protein n=1 Tax=Stackebrandtia albiflava TaxID=406432 RepID=A0A562VA42_9ACTN|nr:molecular chaperone DnaJ [Stackebrandtia albiflava]TWJ14735.1 hypothetical protein LX16_0424 [Stackebrandtia albiflava]